MIIMTSLGFKKDPAHLVDLMVVQEVKEDPVQQVVVLEFLEVKEDQVRLADLMVLEFKEDPI